MGGASTTDALAVPNTNNSSGETRYWAVGWQSSKAWAIGTREVVCQASFEVDRII